MGGCCYIALYCIAWSQGPQGLSCNWPMVWGRGLLAVRRALPCWWPRQDCVGWLWGSCPTAAAALPRTSGVALRVRQA